MGILFSPIPNSTTALGLQTHAVVSGFIWILEIGTRVLMIAWQTSYAQSQIFSL